jgi:hypothetical protein
MKHSLKGQSFETADELLLGIDALLRGMRKWTLDAAFLDWMQKMRQRIGTNDDYFEGVYTSLVGGISCTRSMMRYSWFGEIYPC